MVKAIVLDIDGVLNSSRSTHVKIGISNMSLSASHAYEDLAGQENGELPYGVRFALRTNDHVCAALVNKLIAESGAYLVLSSTHRMHFREKYGYGSAQHLFTLRLYLLALGIKINVDQDGNPLFGITPTLGRPRGEEVQQYLQDHDGIEEYVILDDSTDFFDHQPLVRCDAAVGMSFENYADACKLLAIPAPGLILL